MVGETNQTDEPETETGTNETDDTSTRTRNSAARRGTVDDPTNYTGEYRGELIRLGQLDYTEDERAIRRWLKTLKVEVSARAAYIKRVRTLSLRSAEVSGPPLVEMDDVDLDALLNRLEFGDHPNPRVPADGYAWGTMRNFEMYARMFFRDHLDRDWAYRMDVRPTKTTKISEKDILTKDEITALFQTAPRSREKALMGLMLSSGQRISAALSLRIGDVDLSARSGVVHLNEDGMGLKGAAGPRPLLWASAYVGNWLESHPNRENDDAPLFCTLKSGTLHERGDVLTDHQARRRLKGTAERAGVDTTKVNPHNFRHTAITRMVHDGLSDQKIKWMVGWGKDSTQFERYAHLRDEEMLAGILEDYDLADPKRDVGRPELTECPRPTCREPLRPGAVSCPGCATLLDHSGPSSAETVDGLADAANAAGVETDDAALREVLYHMGRALAADDDLRDEAVKAFLPDDAKGNAPAPPGAYRPRE